MIYDPMRDELFCARRGAGAQLNGAPMRVADTSDLGKATIEIGWNLRGGAAAYVALLTRIVATGAGIIRAGSGALGLAYVAAGRRDGYVENHINSWDCLAGNLLVAEAGGYVSDFLAGEGLRKGNPLIGCAPGVKAALIEAAAIKDLEAMSGPDLIHAFARRGERDDRAGRRRGAGLARRRASSFCGPAIRRSGTRSVRSCFPSSAGRATARGSTGAIIRSGCTDLPPRETFALEAHGESAARLTLARQCAKLSRVYPFAFRLTIDYRLGDAALEIAVEVENPG